MGRISFKAIDKFLEKAERLTDDKLWLWSANQKAVKDEIIRLNTEDQLYERGIDSNEESLGIYSSLTVTYKKRAGQRYDHVTLKDTGDFYGTWRVKVDLQGIELYANDEKGDKALFEVYGYDVLGLTDFNKQRIRTMIIFYYLAYARAELFR
jgi:hypothetical protein